MNICKEKWKAFYHSVLEVVLHGLIKLRGVFAGGMKGRCTLFMLYYNFISCAMKTPLSLAYLHIKTNGIDLELLLFYYPFFLNSDCGSGKTKTYLLGLRKKHNIVCKFCCQV